MQSPNNILFKVEKILKNTHTTKQKHKVLGTRRDIPLFWNTIVQFCYLYNLWISLFSCTYFLKTMLNLYVFFLTGSIPEIQGFLSSKSMQDFWVAPSHQQGRDLWLSHFIHSTLLLSQCRKPMQNMLSTSTLDISQVE